MLLGRDVDIRPNIVIVEALVHVLIVVTIPLPISQGIHLSSPLLPSPQIHVIEIKLIRIEMSTII
jgi:hypothetical protein